LVLDEISKEGQNVRKAYQRRYPSDTSKDYYFMQRNTGVTEPITIEYGFLDSTKDDVNQLKTNYRRYAEAVVRAVLRYLDIPTGDDNTYVVKTGDTLYSIAKKYGLTLAELKEANNLSTNVLNIGQKLIIPTSEPIEEIEGYETYTVKSGDNLYSIAKKYNTTVNELTTVNNLLNNNLSIGQKILVPTGKENVEEIYTTYIVKSGDTLYNISNKYNVSVNEIKGFNNLVNNNLSIGQILKIPTGDIKIEDDSNIIYTVKSGDTLYSIANKYNVNQNEIMDYNNLTSNLLNIGQQLIIPTSNSGVKYVVKSGDSLYSIAKKFNTTVNNIKDKNNLTSNLLNIGQTLII